MAEERNKGDASGACFVLTFALIGILTSSAFVGVMLYRTITWLLNA